MHRANTRHTGPWYPQTGHAGSPIPRGYLGNSPGVTQPGLALTSPLKAPCMCSSLEWDTPEPARDPQHSRGPSCIIRALHCLPLLQPHKTGILGQGVSCQVIKTSAMRAGEEPGTRLGGGLRAGRTGLWQISTLSSAQAWPSTSEPGPARRGSGFSSHSLYPQGLPPRAELEGLPSHTPHSYCPSLHSHSLLCAPGRPLPISQRPLSWLIPPTSLLGINLPYSFNKAQCGTRLQPLLLLSLSVL